MTGHKWSNCRPEESPENSTESEVRFNKSYLYPQVDKSSSHWLQMSASDEGDDIEDVPDD